VLRRLLFVLFFAFTTAVPAVAADFDRALNELNQRNFKKKTAAMEAVAASGHERVVPVLQALRDGLLLARKSDKRVVIGQRVGRTYMLTDAATGEALGKVGNRDVSKITANNKMRVAINALLGGLMLSSPSADDRMSAARQILDKPKGVDPGPVAEALTKETDDGVRAVLARALAAVDLSSDAAGDRLAAIAGLSGSANLDTRRLLLQVAESDEDSAVAAAAAAEVARIDSRLAVVEVGQNLIFGLSLGSVLLLTAIGLAITFGVMGVINMAHGEMIMIGAYTTFVVQEVFRVSLPPEVFGLYLVAAVPMAFFVSGAVGVAMERGIIRFLYGRPLETLLATWGVSLALQQAVRSLFGATNREVANPDWMSGSVELFAGLSITSNRLVIIGFGFAVLIALALVIRYTRFGLNMRAVTQNRPMASAMGIPAGTVDALTFGLGSGIAGIAGVALSQITNVSPNLGQNYIVDSFMVVVFGGVGSLWGVLLGAFSLGIVNKFLEPFAGAILGKILVLVFIILFIQKRPRGLFALKGRAFES
jgi:urea transport system permease protein